MPTFDETVRIERSGDGEVLLDLATERGWELRQLGTGAGAALELASVGGGGNKNLIITTTGRVGIGTATPDQTLDVNGGLRIVRTGSGAVLLQLSSERGWEFRQLGSGAGTALELASVGGGGNKNLIITTTGRVGIGTATPEQTLDVNGSIRVAEDIVLEGADCAEDFDIDPDSDVVPGTVMVIGAEGRLRHCSAPYDRRVAGVVSGAGDRRPGIVLGRRSSATAGVGGSAGSAGGRVPLALAGTVLCNVDATEAAIDVGDLLTTSPLAGHAMRATDPTRAFGAVVGKALQAMDSGTGTIPVLVALT
jgi:hypothetical protein